MRQIAPILLLFLCVNLTVFYPVFKGFIPMPVDLLVGAYYPWLDYKWGTTTGVPIKNPAISDVISQTYPWRQLAVSMLRQGQIPLWNPYAFSGTPLLATLHSATLYPLNILMLVFGDIWGWSLMIFLQPMLSMIFMFFYLRQIRLKIASSILGSIVFAYSGFMVTYLEYATAGQVLLWLPLALFCIEKYLDKKINWLFLLPIICFFIFTAGNFQASLYSYVLIVAYFIARLVSSKKYQNWKSVVFSGFILIACLAIASIQLLPTFELLNLSFRDLDTNILSYNDGLLPLKNLITFISPDFFGNNATGNFWGVLGYHESTGYFGVVPLILITLAISKFRNLGNFYFKFFSILLALVFLLVFDTSFSRLVYQYNLPLLSTSFASRALMLLSVAVAVLSAFGLEVNGLQKSRLGLVALGLVALITGFEAWLYFTHGTFLYTSHANLEVAVKNTLWPLGLVLFTLAATFIIKKPKILIIFLLAISTFDLLHFTTKFSVFSPISWVFPQTPILEFTKTNLGYYRIEREHGAILPPNSWLPYRLMSPSGYDPLYSKNYNSFYNVYVGNRPDSTPTRYAELGRYDLPFMDLAGVKYLLSSSDNSYPKFKTVFQDHRTRVLENTAVEPRVKLFSDFIVEPDTNLALSQLYQGFDFKNRVILDSKPKEYIPPFNLDKSSTQAYISRYTETMVEIKATSDSAKILLLTDSFYPGWKAYVNQSSTKIFRADGIFRAVVIPKGESAVLFKYQPDSFRNGASLSLISLVSVGVFFFFRKRVFVGRQGIEP